MLVFANANLVLFSIPKTGSTAYHLLLRKKADIAFSRKPELKHINIRKYEKFIAPYLKDVLGVLPERVAVMRDPLAQLDSWFRYRKRDSMSELTKSTAGMSFDDFLLAYMREEPKPVYAKLGSQFSFVTTSSGAIGVTHLFAQERGHLLDEFLQQRLKMDCTTKLLNVSPKMELKVNPEIEEMLRQHLANDFALHAKILEAGGHLVTKLRE